MKTGTVNRRKLLRGIAAGVAGGLVGGTGASAEPRAASRSEYLLEDGLTYLNTGTLGPCRRATVEATMRAWERLEALPIRFYGRFGAEEFAERTRSVAARFLRCDLAEIAVTTSTTGGMNAVAQGLRLEPGDRIVITDQEHSGGVHGWQYLAKYQGAELDVVAIPRGEQDPGALVARIAAKIGPRTRVISVSHVTSSTGLRLPIAEISALARSKGVLCVVDGAQSVGAVQVDVRALGCHAYATSGHKWLMGPKGTGLLYVAADAQDQIRPMQCNDSFSTYGQASGTTNLAGLLGLAAAIEHLESIGMAAVEARALALRSRLAERLRGTPGLEIVGAEAGPLAGPMLTCVLPASIDRTAFVGTLLDRHRISIRATHAEFGFNGIRFSTHVFNTEAEIDRVAAVVRTELAALTSERSS